MSKTSRQFTSVSAPFFSGSESPLKIAKLVAIGYRGGICHCRHCRRQCKFFAIGVNFSIFTNFFVLLSLKLLKLGEIDSVNFLA